MHLDVPTSICNLKDATFATRGVEPEADKLYAQQLVDTRVVLLVNLGLSVKLLSIWTSYVGVSGLCRLTCSSLIWDVWRPE